MNQETYRHTIAFGVILVLVVGLLCFTSVQCSHDTMTVQSIEDARLTQEKADQETQDREMAKLGYHRDGFSWTKDK